ncbi:MAG: radical SAM protein [Acidobacteria bacterium]|uniref:Radical SAM protein n=1 Tax=Candidatus Polarisedimenticola svalbardensis TaxID=2886004 RepID=A0A8J7CCM7_9BACT|nr:radical SAM protein [Candidatus Polarisedimenticola svalbardensis]
MSDQGQGKTAYRDMVETAFAQSVPLSAQFEITYRCNHLCTFCYNSPTGQRELRTPQIFEILKKISDFGVLYLTLTGGEPLCHRDFYKIAGEVRRLGMALRIYSNGYLMSDPKVLERIMALHPLEVEISIHGARPESHEALTKIKGSFEKTVKAIGLLSEAGQKVNLKCPITRHNQDELFDVKKIADRYGYYVTFDPVITPKDDGDTGPLSLSPDNAFFTRYWQEDYIKLHDGRLPPRANHCAPEGTEAVCGAGRTGFTVDPYGNMFPCVAFRRKIGNLLEVDKIDDIWGESPVLEQVRGLGVNARDNLNKREDGKYFTFCMGVAETQLGDPLAIYPQAETNARAVRRAYDLLKIEDGSGKKSA